MMPLATNGHPSSSPSLASRRSPDGCTAPHEVVIVARTQETPSIFSLDLRFTDPQKSQEYRAVPGQFNMLYRFGVGEVPISIVSDPSTTGILKHTIRAVGRVTHSLAALQVGDRLGLRGPFGRGWPLHAISGKDIVIITGGLGCAPVVALIEHLLAQRAQFHRLVILQGVKHADDLIWRRQYAAWERLPDTQVLLAADLGGPSWPFHVGNVTVLLDQAEMDPAHSLAFLCGPEAMMQAAIHLLLRRGLPPEALWLSMERNMSCGMGRCGRCQIGPHFVCRDGPVLHFPAVRAWLGMRGF